MGLEAVTYIADLVTTNPIGASDPKSEGDDHIRNIKKALQNCFPSLGGRIFRSQTQSGNYLVVAGDAFTRIDCTTNINLTYPAANTLGNGWMHVIHADGGDVTLVPNGTDKINGINTNFTVPNTWTAIIWCDNVNLFVSFMPMSVGNTGVPTAVSLPWSGIGAVPSGWLLCDGTAYLRSTYASLFASMVKSGTVTMTIASPCTVTWTGHGRINNDSIKFTTTGGLPTGLVAGTTYYIKNKTTNTFEVSATPGGVSINTSGVQSGVQTGIHAPHGDGDGSTTFNVPDYRGRHPIGRDAGANRVTAAISGIFGDTIGAVGGDERMHQHAHGVTDPTHAHVEKSRSGVDPKAGALHFPTDTIGDGGATQTTAISTAASGTGISINNSGLGNSQNMSPVSVEYWIIKT